MIVGIDHLVLTVKSVEDSLAFYERVLGMQREITPNRPAALRFGSQKINLHRTDRPFEPKAARPTSGSGDFCLITDQPLEEVLVHLARAGVPVVLGPISRNGARGPMMSVYFRDPDGNSIEVSRYDESSAGYGTGRKAPI